MANRGQELPKFLRPMPPTSPARTTPNPATWSHKLQVCPLLAETTCNTSPSTFAARGCVNRHNAKEKPTWSQLPAVLGRPCPRGGLCGALGQSAVRAEVSLPPPPGGPCAVTRHGVRPLGFRTRPRWKMQLCGTIPTTMMTPHQSRSSDPRSRICHNGNRQRSGLKLSGRSLALAFGTTTLQAFHELRERISQSFVFSAHVRCFSRVLLFSKSHSARSASHFSRTKF